MRKQKIIKMTASPLDPSLGGSFQPPATHNGDISIVFRGKNMSIHGWDGSAWSTIYTRNGNDKQFTFPHTYENYYVKSLTGSDETFSASFFSTGKYERSTPLLAGVQRDTKLHDIEEVPIYTASDANKLLTIMSDGSLRWLGISESYIVEVIGTGGETQAPAGTPNVTGGIEVLQTNTLSGDAQVTANEGLLITNSGYTDTQSNYHNSATQQTISAWFKASELGTVADNSDIQWRDNGHVIAITRDYVSLGRANGFMMSVASNAVRFTGPHQSNTVAHANYSFSVDTWYKVDMTWTSDSMKFYVNGVLLGSSSPSGSIAGGAFPLRIGKNINDWMNFKGNILGLTVENVAKSDGEILSSYEAEKPEETEQPSEGNAAPVEFLEDRFHSSVTANYSSPNNYRFRSPYDDATGVLSVGQGTDRVAILNISGATEPFATNNDAANDGDLTKKVAISFWYKGGSWQTNIRTYASLFNVQNETGQTLFGLRMSKNNYYNGFFVGTPYSEDTLGSARAFTNENGFHIDNISDQNWHHIVYYYDGASTGSQKIFVDGVLAASKAHGSGAVTIDRYMSSGANSMIFNADNADDYTGGDFDSIAFYQGLEFTEAMAAEIYADSTRQGSVSQSPAPAAPAGPQASFIEDNAGFTGTVVDGIWTDSGSGGGHWSQIRLSADGIIDYTNGEPTHDEFTISWWMNLNPSQAATNVTVAGRHLGTVNGVNRNFKINLGNVGGGVTNPHFQVYLGSTIMSNLNTGVNMGDTWTHCAVVCKSDGSQLVISAYLNGNKLSGTRTKPLGTKLLLPEAYDGFGWGGNGQSGSTVKGQFDSMQIEGGIALTDEQVAAIAAQADRQMGIAAAAGVSQEAPSEPTGAGTFLEEQTPMNTPYAAGGVSSVDNGVLTSRVGTAFLENADVPEIDTSATEAVFSMWYNPVDSRLGLYSNSGNSAYRNFSIMQVSPTRLRIYSPIGNGNNIDLSSTIVLNEWNHIVVTVSSNIAYSSSSSKSLTLKVYLNGQEIYSKTGNTTGTVRRNLNDGKHYFGALHLNWNTSEKGEAQFDFVEWVDNVSLTDAQILAMYNNGERGWSVADGAAS